MAFLASFVAYMVLALVWFSESSISRTRSAQYRRLSQLGPTSIAPANLSLAAEGFRIGVRVEAPAFPIDDVTNLKAWDELQTTLVPMHSDWIF